MAKRDYYEILGLRKNAAGNEIKKAYRRLARKHHPDLNPGDESAAEVFKGIQEAYDVLSDPEKRKVYDQLGFYKEGFRAGEEGYGGRGFPGFQGFWGFRSDPFKGGGGRGGLGEIFSELFSSQASVRQSGTSAGRDLEHYLTISFLEAVRSTRVRFKLQSEAYGPERVRKVEDLNVRIPAGVNTGSRVRVPGKGNQREAGGLRGDLYLVINVQPHEFFERRGDDVLCRVPITITEAALGARIEVPTTDGKALLRIPPGSQGGQKFRLRGLGVRSAQNGRRGDQLVEVRLVVPQIRDERSKEILREFSRLNPFDPRAEMG